MQQWSYAEYLVRLRWLDDVEWSRPDRRSFELAKGFAKLYVTQLAEGGRVDLKDFLFTFDPHKSSRERTEQKPLPPLKLMELPSDHPFVLGAKLRWQTLMAQKGKPPSKVK
jgi:hypothetical protein